MNRLFWNPQATYLYLDGGGRFYRERLSFADAQKLAGTQHAEFYVEGKLVEQRVKSLACLTWMPGVGVMAEEIGVQAVQPVPDWIPGAASGGRPTGREQGEGEGGRPVPTR